jgi:phage-related minor tail protein
LEDSIVKFAQTGKISFSDMANSIIADIIRIGVRQSMTGLFGMSGLGGIFSNIFGPAPVVGYGGAGDVMGASLRAEGGPVSPGQPYIVGERGPELFLPRSAGTIIPNDQMGGAGSIGGTVVNYNISAVDAASFKQLVARDPQFIYNVTEAGRRSQPSRRLS